VNPLILSTRSWLVALPAALLLTCAVASPALASPETLKRSVSNILFGPLDFALGPVTGARSVYNNLRDIDDTMGVRVAYAVPGVVWNSAMQMSGGVLRLITGVIELVPGLFLLPFEADMDPLLAVVDRADALIDEEYDFMPVKIGVSYVD